MFRVLKVVVFLAVVGLIGLAGYAYLGDMAPVVAPSEVPVTLTPR